MRPFYHVRSVLFSEPAHTLAADKLAHAVIPRHPPLRPHARMVHHFRFILPLLGKDEDGLTPLHYYDSAIQLVRHASREPTEQEYMVGMRAAKEIQGVYVVFLILLPQPLIEPPM